MASNTEIIIISVCLAKVPVVAGEQGICAGCGIATLSISYYDIGYKAGEMAYDILENGKDISTMEIETAPNVTRCIIRQFVKNLASKFRMNMKQLSRNKRTE